MYSTERIFVRLSLILCGAIAARIFYDIVIRYETKSDVLTIERNYMEWNITFPSLTLCSKNKINRTALENYLDQSNVTDKEVLEEFIELVASLRYDWLGVAALIPYLPEITGEEIIKMLDETTYNNEVIAITSDNEEIPLVRILTEVGVCYAFNSKLAPYLSFPYILNDGFIEEVPTLKTSMYDIEKLIFSKGMNNCCEIYYHTEIQTVDVKRSVIAESDRMTTILLFKAIPITASPDFRKLSINRRKCRFLDESNLPHSRVFSTDLCRMECRIMAMTDLCNCILFFYKALEDEVYCNSEGIRCIAVNFANIKTKADQCDCVKNCEETQFELHDTVFTEWSIPPTVQWSVQPTKIRLRYDVIYTETDALIGLGNVCNMLLGISFITVIHFIFTGILLLKSWCVKWIRK